MSAISYHVGLLQVDLHVPNSRSLKAKRGVIKRLKDRIRNKFNVSVAEVGGLDKWQRSVLAISCVGNDQAQLDRVFQEVKTMLELQPETSILDTHVQFL